MKRRKRNKIINLIQSALIFVFCSLAFVTVVFTWFTMFVENTVSGIRLTTQSPEIYISDTITVRRGFDEKEENKIEITFNRDADGVYYEYFKEEGEEEGAWVLDAAGNKKPLSIKGLWPGESIDFLITVIKTKASDDLSVNLRIDNIIGDTFVYQGLECSVLVVYRINIFDDEGNMLDKEGNVIYSPDGIPYEGYDVVENNLWIDVYGDENPYLTTVNVISDEYWGEGEKEIVLRFRITFDVSQIGSQGVNDLSERGFSIGRIVVTAYEN